MVSRMDIRFLLIYQWISLPFNVVNNSRVFDEIIITNLLEYFSSGGQR